MAEKVNLEFIICNPDLFKECVECGGMNKAQEKQCFACGSDNFEKVSFRTILGLISKEESQTQIQVSE